MQRSEVMRRVKSHDTTPERAVRAALCAIGAKGYRLHRRDLPGAPDIAFIARARAIFVHGCFWHGHDCRRGARTPKSNTEYWTAKIDRNRARDAAALDALAARGWATLVIWECETRDAAALQQRLDQWLSVG
ncbi:MAG: DNA mismatch endonuclease Vsr [Pseudomonadota bacterium]